MSKEYDSRVNFAVPPALTAGLREEVYPAGEYPEVQSVQDCYRRAAGEILRQARTDSQPGDIFERLLQSAKNADGMLQLVVGNDGDSLIDPSTRQAIRQPDQQNPNTPTVLFEDLSDADLRTALRDISPREFRQFIIRMGRIHPEYDSEGGLARLWHDSDVAADVALREAIEQGFIEPDELRAATERAISAAKKREE